MVSPCRTERDRTCALAMAAGPVSFSKPSGRWRDAARWDARLLIPMRSEPRSDRLGCRLGCAGLLTMFAWSRRGYEPTRFGARPKSHLVPPFASPPNFNKWLIYLMFLWKKILPFTGTKEYLGRYPRQVGVRPGLTEGFSTHGRISRSRDIYSAAELCIPRVERERLRYRFARVRGEGRNQPADAEFPSATSWLTSRRSRRGHGAAMTAPLRS